MPLTLYTLYQDLERDTQAYISAPASAAASPHLEKLRAHLVDYRSHGAELVRIADDRQSAVKEFRDRFEALDGRTKASLARSWKIFGRVIARKSLVDLNSSLDTLRRSFASLPSAGSYDSGALDPVSVSEKALTASLQTSEPALRHSQGDTWFMQTRADVEQISALQESLIRMDTRRHASLDSFAKESLRLMAVAGAGCFSSTSTISRISTIAWAMRSGTAGFAARLGGDEFTIVCGDAMNVDAVSRIGWDLVRAFQQPGAIGGGFGEIQHRTRAAPRLGTR